MQLNTLDKLLKKKQPQIYDKIHSEQHKLSIELLKLRTENKLSVEELSSIIGITEKEYLDFEFGELNKTIQEYNQLIDKAKQEIAFRNNTRTTPAKIIVQGVIKAGVDYRQPEEEQSWDKKGTMSSKGLA